MSMLLEPNSSESLRSRLGSLLRDTAAAAAAATSASASASGSGNVVRHALAESVFHDLLEEVTLGIAFEVHR